MKIAAATYPVDWHNDWASYEVKVSRWVVEAAQAGAELLVFPEYGAMELASLAGAEIAADMQAGLRAVFELKAQADQLYARLAAEHGVFILGASGPCFEGGGLPTNRAGFFTPDGQIGFQDKQIMTCGERDFDVRGDGPLRVFDTEIGKIGVVICYDSEFPALSRALIEQGVEILLVPSCTDTVAGYWRVRIGAMARALEGQCVVVHSPLVGVADWSPIVDIGMGAAAIYGPPDLGFPETGVLAEGAMNAPAWVYADVSLEAVHEVRRGGTVRNMTHWPEQDACVKRIETVELKP